MRKYTIEQVESAVKSSVNFAEVLEKLDLVVAGGNFRTIKTIIKNNNIEHSHLSRGNIRKTNNRVTLEDVLKNNATIATFKLKQMLFKNNIFDYKCNKCGLEKWLGEDISLELHHKDGNTKNNLIENLEILCPNCHATTDNYRGKNKIRVKDNYCNLCKKICSRYAKLCRECNDKEKAQEMILIVKKVVKEKKKPQQKKCLDCDKSCNYKSQRCKSCAAKYVNLIQNVKYKKPPKEDLINKMIELKCNMCALARYYEVSDNGVRKWILSYDINILEIKNISKQIK